VFNISPETLKHLEELAPTGATSGLGGKNASGLEPHTEYL